MKIYDQCNPIVVNKDILSTSDYEFMTKKRIKEQCKCINKQTCMTIVELFNSWKIEEWKNLLNLLQNVEKI